MKTVDTPNGHVQGGPERKPPPYFCENDASYLEYKDGFFSEDHVSHITLYRQFFSVVKYAMLMK